MFCTYKNGTAQKHLFGVCYDLNFNNIKRSFETFDGVISELLYQEDDYDEPTLSHSLGSNAAALANNPSGVAAAASTRRLSYPHQHSPSSNSGTAQMDVAPLTSLENGATPGPGAPPVRRPNSRVVPPQFNPSDSSMSGVADTLDVGGPRFSKVH